MTTEGNDAREGDQPAPRLATRSPVLVLNQNYQPLNICDVRRAISLLGRGKAETLDVTETFVRSAYAAMPAPAVIRLVYMVRRPLHQRRLSRREIFVRDGYRCQYCGTQTRHLTLDHVIPRSRGGQQSWTNVVSACTECNHHKAGRTPSEARMKLMREPAPPRPNPYAFFHVGQMRDSWRPFLPWLEAERAEQAQLAGVAAGG
ncbi:MAG: HNH endonuclease [SAR202 cluster bacterium]|nr:HNH endonuclease [SAR202 cluster bacterium]